MIKNSKTLLFAGALLVCHPTLLVAQERGSRAPIGGPGVQPPSPRAPVSSPGVASPSPRDLPAPDRVATSPDPVKPARAARPSVRGGDPFGGGGDPFNDDLYGFDEGPVFNLDFPGGTIYELVELVKKSSEEPLNIVVPNGFDSLAMPRLELHGVDFEEVAEIVHYSTKGPRGGAVMFEPVGNSWIFVHEMRPEEPRDVAIFPAGALLAERSMEDLLALVENAFAISGASAPPKLHFHAETQILMGSLTRGEKAMLSELFAVLGQADERVSGEERQRLESDAKMREQAAMEDQVRQLQAEMAALRSRLLEVQSRGLEPKKPVR